MSKYWITSPWKKMYCQIFILSGDGHQFRWYGPNNPNIVGENVGKGILFSLFIEAPHILKQHDNTTNLTHMRLNVGTNRQLTWSYALKFSMPSYGVHISCIDN